MLLKNTYHKKPTDIFPIFTTYCNKIWLANNINIKKGNRRIFYHPRNIYQDFGRHKLNFGRFKLGVNFTKHDTLEKTTESYSKHLKKVSVL